MPFETDSGLAPSAAERAAAPPIDRRLTLLQRSPLAQLTVARAREFYRRPSAIFWVYGFPLLLALALSLAFQNRPVRRIAIDVAAGPGGESALAALAADPALAPAIHEVDEARRRLRKAQTDLVVVPSASGNEYDFDPARPESVLARAAADAALLRAGPARGAPPAVDRPAEAAGGRYIDFLIPGLLGMNLMGGGLWGVGYGVVDLRVRKLLKRYIATPMRRSQFLASMVVNRVIFTLPFVLVLLTFASLIFGVAVNGSFASLLAVVLVGAMAFMGIGLLTASRAQSIEAISGLMNLVMLPMYVFSGVFFSSERFPAAIQPVIKVLPLTALNDALRGVMTDGEPLAAQTMRLAILLAWGGVTFVLALRWFRWQ
jgi:ABC-type multidrug transport system permease subunit